MRLNTPNSFWAFWLVTLAVAFGAGRYTGHSLEMDAAVISEIARKVVEQLESHPPDPHTWILQSPIPSDPEDEERALEAASDAEVSKKSAMELLSDAKRIPKQNTSFAKADRILHEAKSSMNNGKFSEAISRFRAAETAFRKVLPEPIGPKPAPPLSQIVDLERQAMALRDGLLSQQVNPTFKAAADLLTQGTTLKLTGNLGEAGEKFNQAIRKFKTLKNEVTNFKQMGEVTP